MRFDDKPAASTTTNNKNNAKMELPSVEEVAVAVLLTKASMNSYLPLVRSLQWMLMQTVRIESATSTCTWCCFRTVRICLQGVWRVILQ